MLARRHGHQIMVLVAWKSHENLNRNCEGTHLHLYSSGRLFPPYAVMQIEHAGKCLCETTHKSESTT